MSILENLPLSTDVYKGSHWVQYPEGATRVHSHIAARKSTIPGCNVTVWNGLQPYIKDRLLKPVTKYQVFQAHEIFAAIGVPFNFDGWMHIVNKHGGFLPVHIQAVPEGTVVPVGNVLLTVSNTDHKVPWLTNYIETDLMRLWYPTTVASISRHCKQIILKYLEETGDPSGIDFKLHDFGFRGVSSFESAAIGGAAHLINFKGTDTIAGILHAMQYYNAEVCGFSIPAAEHSTITSWGRDHEADAYANMVKQYAKSGAVFAVVSDSYDLWKAIDTWGSDPRLLQTVKERGATVVIRPDSGDPLTVPRDAIARLMNICGHETNSKGYDVLPPHVRVIQGDGIDVESLPKILHNLKADKISADNIAFGMGGGLLQKCNRDTFSFAMKANAIEIGDTIRDVYKDPVTDSGKRSLRGLVKLFTDGKQYISATQEEMYNMGLMSRNWNDKQPWWTALQTMYEYVREGRVTTNFTSWDEVRERAKC